MAQTKKPATIGNQSDLFFKPFENGDMPEALGNLYKSYFDGVTEITTELMGFIETRIARDMELGKDLSQCQDWTSASKLQSDWSRQTQEDYFQESKKLSDMATSMMHRSMEPWTHFSK